MVEFFVIYRRATQSRVDQADDVSKLLAFFTECKQENPHFFSDFQLNKEGRIMSIFWSYASMQGEYADFGDVVTFDTTYKTNLYNKPLAMFVGANHHLQCTVFGIALLGDETTETFKWVFSTFKKCMDGVSPKCILTGIDYMYSLSNLVVIISRYNSTTFKTRYELCTLVVCINEYVLYALLVLELM